MTPTMQGLLVAFLILTGVFWLIERVSPGVKGQKKLRRGFRTDTFYWFFSPLVTGTLSRIIIALVLAPLLHLAGRSLERAEVLAGSGPIAELPVAVQAMLLLVVGDFIGYWAHRWFHRHRLWPFHAVHHSSNDLDWLSSVRVHPVNDVLGKTLQGGASGVARLLASGRSGVRPVLDLLRDPAARERIVDVRPVAACDREPGVSSLASQLRGAGDG